MCFLAASACVLGICFSVMSDPDTVASMSSVCLKKAGLSEKKKIKKKYMYIYIYICGDQAFCNIYIYGVI